MAEFQRARSAEQKEQRMTEIKDAARSQFHARPYHEITLTTIAEELSWSRANLYKYVTTKEEVFLSLAADERNAYYQALIDAFPEGAHPGHPDAAQTWSDVVVAHRDWFRLHAILFTLLEQNSSFEKLVAFKKGHFDRIGEVERHVCEALGVPVANFNQLMAAINYFAMGIASDCCGTPRVQAALAEIGHAHPSPVLADVMPDFILMCLEHYAR